MESWVSQKSSLTEVASVVSRWNCERRCSSLESRELRLSSQVAGVVGVLSFCLLPTVGNSGFSGDAKASPVKQKWPLVIRDKPTHGASIHSRKAYAGP
ncbi:hypothetical protein NL676_003228 [Syzygium grande]|nr:hypothetical protein NL676_003228 [Syzygium grande]